MKLLIKHRFSSVKNDWDRLYHVTPNVSPFLSSSAFSIAYRYFYPYYLLWHALPIFAVFTVNNLVRGIVPLIKYQGKYHLFGDVNGFNECGFLYDDSSILPEIMESLHNFFGEIEFMKIDERSPLSMFKGNNAIPSNNVAIWFDNKFDDYFKTLSKSVRQNIRTAYNRISTDGYTISMEYYLPGTGACVGGGNSLLVKLLI